MVVTVNDVLEPGIVTLSSLQPQVDTPLTATLAPILKLPNIAPGDVAWKWEQSRSRTSGWTAIGGADVTATHLPDANTDGYYLRATATYMDADNNDRTAQAVSVNKVRMAPATGRNQLPSPSRRTPMSEER